jgi:aminopeptidase N
VISGRLPNATFRATLDGFADQDAGELLEPYASRYFDVVGDIWRDWGSDMAQYFAKSAYPSWKVTPEGIAAADAYIERADPPPALRRLLAEGRDDVARALRCRHRDAQSG